MSCPICDNKPANCDCSAEAIELHEENEKLTAERGALALQISELKSVLKESASYAEALRALSFGLYERIHGRHDWVVPSATQTALNYIDHMTWLNGELRALLEKLVDSEPCRMDHHGNCQTHRVENPCSVEMARVILRKSQDRKGACTHNAVNPSAGHTLCLKDLPCPDHEDA